MWTWSDLHCDYVHPVGEGFHGQFWLRNNSIVRIDGESEFENECISDKDSKWKYGLIMHPQTQNWTEGFYLPHGWKEEFGCLENGSCFYVGNATNDYIEFNLGFFLQHQYEYLFMYLRDQHLRIVYVGYFIKPSTLLL